ncbi:hypothetical protein T4E_1023 [Trichinella pseudospiralis]|uniref:Uncharacterized protein n=1 Tax=Trichinella pseudospiralis TaxID=6337 RepID=A0A0V0Y393_TRIPS|nr:hypothetical protein T4E_1023 [Trichinella pseudospiralis]
MVISRGNGSGGERRGGGGGGAMEGWVWNAVKIDHRSYNNDHITLPVDLRTRPKNGLVKSEGGGSVDKMIDGHRFWLA